MSDREASNLIAYEEPLVVDNLYPENCEPLAKAPVSNGVTDCIIRPVLDPKPISPIMLGPNITGRLYRIAYCGQAGEDGKSLYASDVTTLPVGSTSGTSTFALNLDASRSSSTYTDNGQVKNKSLSLNYVIKG